MSRNIVDISASVVVSPTLGSIGYGQVFIYPNGDSTYMKIDGFRDVNRSDDLPIVQLETGRVYYNHRDKAVIPALRDAIVKIRQG